MRLTLDVLQRGVGYLIDGHWKRLHAKESLVNPDEMAKVLDVEKAAKAKNWKERTAFFGRWKAERSILNAVIASGAELPKGTVRPPSGALTPKELAGTLKYGLLGDKQVKKR